MQRFLPPPDLTILLDIAPETAAQRKAAGRDRYERDLALLSRVRESYHRQARRRRAGCASTASARATPCRRTCSPQSRHDSRRGKRAHLPRPGPSQHARARLERRAGRAHIVHQQHRQPIDVGAVVAARTRRARCACRRAAGRSVCDAVARVRRSTFAIGRPRCRASSSRLVEAARAPPRRCSGTGTTRSAPDSERRRRWRIISARADARAIGAAVLQRVDDRAQRAVVCADRARRRDSRCRCAGSAGMSRHRR